MFFSGVCSLKLARGMNQSSDPLRWQSEQLHASTSLMSPSASKAMPPQWQLPLYFIT